MIDVAVERDDRLAPGSLGDAGVLGDHRLEADIRATIVIYCDDCLASAESVLVDIERVDEVGSRYGEGPTAIALRRAPSRVICPECAPAS